MRWRILQALSFLFSALAFGWAGVLGNSATASAFNPVLAPGTNVFVRIVFWILIIPDKVADRLISHTWLKYLSWTPAWHVILILFISAAILKIGLVAFSSLGYRMVAAAVARKEKTDTNSVYLALRGRPDVRRRIKAKQVLAVAGATLGFSVLYFAIGALAGGYAWILSIVCNSIHGGFLQVFIVCVLLFFAWLAAFIVNGIVDVIKEQLADDMEERGELFPDLR
jgi:hypothetical protein